MNDTDPTSGEKISEQPKFFKAIFKTEQFLTSADQESIRIYFDNPSKISNYAQSFDMIAGPNPIEVNGDTTRLRHDVANNLRHGIDEYSGPVEIKQIYDDLYSEDIKRILGE